MRWMTWRARRDASSPTESRGMTPNMTKAQKVTNPFLAGLSDASGGISPSLGPGGCCAPRHPRCLHQSELNRERVPGPAPPTHVTVPSCPELNGTQ